VAQVGSLEAAPTQVGAHNSTAVQAGIFEIYVAKVQTGQI